MSGYKYSILMYKFYTAFDGKREYETSVIFESNNYDSTISKFNDLEQENTNPDISYEFRDKDSEFDLYDIF